MENNSGVPQFQPPVPEQEPQTAGVWLSQEEYERLRSGTSQVQSPAQASIATNVVVPADGVKKNLWTYLGGAAAVLVFIGMTSQTGSLFTVPLMIALVVFVALAVKSLVKPASVGGLYPAGTVVAPTKKSSAGKIVLAIILLALFIPVAPFALMILFLMFMLLTGQEVGS
ncbi:MAG TPA: hypothetical protein PKD28_02205 [Candidatus Saccharibacteria bacterium]|nr:hypothetical protein [Candidatus Saccharibacteria bacterium]